MDRYNQRCDKIIESALESTPRDGAVKAFRRFSTTVKIFPGFGNCGNACFEGLYHLAGPDRPPVAEDQENKWGIRENPRRMRGLIR